MTVDFIVSRNIECFALKNRQKNGGIWTTRFFSNKTRNNIIGGPILSPKMLQNERRKAWKSLKCIEISKFSVEEGLTKATEEGNGALGDHFGCSKAHDTHWRDRESDDFRGPGRTCDQEGGVGERLWKCVLQFFVPSAFWLVFVTNKHRFSWCLDTSLIDVGNVN